MRCVTTICVRPAMRRFRAVRRFFSVRKSQRGEAVIKDVDGRVLDDGTRDGKALLLATGEILPACRIS